MDQSEEQKQKLYSWEHSKFAVIGNVDSGKSTLVGVLSKGMNDDGRGSARAKVFTMSHEKENGRTTSVTQEIMGFDTEHKQVLPERYTQNRSNYQREVMQNSKKVAALIDLCGHEKYLKTTLYGLVAMQPDYSLVVIGSNMGVSKMTREHLGVSLFLNIPFIIVLTKIDIAPSNVQSETLEGIKRLIKSPAVKRMPVQFSETSPMDEVDKWAGLMSGNTVVPIFQVSSVTGAGLTQLIRFIAMAPNRDQQKKAMGSVNDPFQFDIQEKFNISGIGVVVSGICKSGRATVGQQVLLGPDKARQFKLVTIKSIQIHRVPVNQVQAGELACFAIKPSKTHEKLDKSELRKGVVLVDQILKPEASWEFEANIHVLHHSTTIGPGYQAYMHSGVVRQAIEIKHIKNKDVLRMNDIALVRLRFMHAAEFIKKDSVLVIREGRSKIFGYITDIISDKQLELEKLENQSYYKPINEITKEGNQKLDNSTMSTKRDKSS